MLARATRRAAAEVLRQLLAPRRLRTLPRVVERKMSNVALKRRSASPLAIADQVARPGRGDRGPNRRWTLTQRHWS